MYSGKYCGEFKSCSTRCRWWAAFQYSNKTFIHIHINVCRRVDNDNGCGTWHMLPEEYPAWETLNETEDDKNTSAMPSTGVWLSTCRIPLLAVRETLSSCQVSMLICSTLLQWRNNTNHLFRIFSALVKEMENNVKLIFWNLIVAPPVPQSNRNSTYLSTRLIARKSPLPASSL